MPIRPAFAAAVVASATFGVAQAQQAAQAPDDGVLAEVIVTAQKRAQSLVEVPISITSTTGESLARSNIEGMIDLAQVTPGLVTNRFGVAVQPAIRGVTTRLGENSVATYVDGFYIPSAVSLNFDFNNVERVDVLKGPQGTLFGRNATGGAIVITTRNPTQETQFQVEAGVEELGGQRASMYASGGLSDTVAVDFAADYRNSDGWVHDVDGGDPINDTEHQNYRARLLWSPSDAVEVTLTGEYGSLSDATTAASFTYYQHRLLPGSTGKNVLSANHEPENDADWRALSAKVVYSMPTMELTSYSSWRKETNQLDVDLDGSTFLVVNTKWDTEQETIQQEFNLASTGAGPLSWVAGLYYFNDRYVRDDVPGNVVVVPLTNQIRVDTEAAAAFADLTYQLTERLSGTVGARYSWEEKTGSFRAPLTGPATTFLEGTADFDDVTPRVVFSYQLAPRTNLYASWTQGFKSGTFNTTGVTVAPTDPESIDAFEVGFKTSQAGYTFDAAAFYYDWTDIQVARYDPTIAGGNVIFNAAKAEIYGAEAQLLVEPLDNLTVRLNAAYTHGEYSDFPNAVVSLPTDPTDPLSPNGGATAQDWSGTQLIRTPERTASLGLNYLVPTDVGAFTFSGNVYYTSEFLPNTARLSLLTGEPDLTAGPYALVNASIMYRPNDSWHVTVYGRNLTDKEYILAHDANAFGQWRLYGEPRVVGIRAGFSF